LEIAVMSAATDMSKPKKIEGLQFTFSARSAIGQSSLRSASPR
jgi:hypothetical protein